MISADTLFIRVGIASLDEMRDRTLAIARGDRRREPDEPKVWFTSIESVARIFSERNMLLLELLRNSEPLSLQDLMKKSAWQEHELIRELHVFERVGLVDIEEDDDDKGIKRLTPTPYNRVKAEVEVGKSRICWEAEIGVAV